MLCLPKASSTNDVALHLAVQGASEGTVVTADEQIKGRGRYGRRWVSTHGKSLAFSIILRPKLHADELPEITLAASVALAKAFESYRLKPLIKWPNDVLLKGGKVCGILTETGPKKDKMPSVILGIGINLNQQSWDFPKELRKTATSFYRSSGRKVEPVEFFRRVLLCLEETYHWVAERRFSKVLFEWRKRAATLGHQVKVAQAGRVFYGQAIDVDEKGALWVRNDTGIVEKVVSGDVEMLPL